MNFLKNIRCRIKRQLVMCTVIVIGLSVPACSTPASVLWDAQILEKEYAPVSLAPFADSINHARYPYPGLVPPYDVYSERQVVGIAANIVLLQNPDGGWAKNLDWQKKYSAEETLRLVEQKTDKYGPSTVDNRNIYTHLEYLAEAYQRYPDKRFALSATLALDWLFAAQHPVSGGFTGADVFGITYNDDVMTGVLSTLRAVSENDALYGFLDQERRTRAKAALEKGIACILKTQIVSNGKLTAWCQQHSHETFAPIKARSFEPVAITAGESVGVIEFLMEIENPSPEVKAAIVAACEWLESVKIEDIKLVQIPAEPATLNGRYSDYEVVLRDVPGATSLWARFYDLETGKPLYYDKDALPRDSFNQLSRERRVGYGYLGNWPRNMLATKWPAWQKKHLGK